MYSYDKEVSKDYIWMLYFNYINKLPLKSVEWKNGNLKADNFLRFIMHERKGTYIVNGGRLAIGIFVETYKV